MCNSPLNLIEKGQVLNKTENQLKDVNYATERVEDRILVDKHIRLELNSQHSTAYLGTMFMGFIKLLWLSSQIEVRGGEYS